MKTYTFKMFIKTKQGQEFLTGVKVIDANNYNAALKLFNRLELPFHHFATVN